MFEFDPTSEPLGHEEPFERLAAKRKGLLASAFFQDKRAEEMDQNARQLAVDQYIQYVNDMPLLSRRIMLAPRNKETIVEGVEELYLHFPIDKGLAADKDGFPRLLFGRTMNVNGQESRFMITATRFLFFDDVEDPHINHALFQLASDEEIEPDLLFSDLLNEDGDLMEPTTEELKTEEEIVDLVQLMMRHYFLKSQPYLEQREAS